MPYSLKVFVLAVPALLVISFSTADEKEWFGGGKNFEFRKNLCKPGGVRKSYNLPNRRLSSNVTLV